MRLGSDQSQHQLMILRIEPGRINCVGRANGVRKIEYGYTGGLESREVGYHVVFRHLAALNGHSGHAADAIERRFERVGCQFPKITLRYGVGGRGEAVAEDWKRRKGKAVGGDFGGGRQLLLDTAEGGVHQFQGAEHVNRPVEEEADLSRAAARGGAHGSQSGHGVDGVFDGFGDGDLHLFDRHYAVVDADHDTGKVCLWKDGDGRLKERENADCRQRKSDEKDGADPAREPKCRSQFDTG